MKRLELKRCWINQPSRLQRWHNLHGTNVLVDYSENLHPNVVTIYFLSGSVISQRVTKEALSENWRH